MTLDNLHVAGSGIPEMTARVFQAGGKRLTELQRRVLQRAYMRHTGHLDAQLSGDPVKVQQSGSDVSMTIDYLGYMKFLDLKKTSKGKRKKRYAPIYNKYVFGFLMGYTYNNLRAGMAEVADRELPTTTINIIQ